MKPRRVGLSLCSGAKSPAGSHQASAIAENRATSAGSMLELIGASVVMRDLLDLEQAPVNACRADIADRSLGCAPRARPVEDAASVSQRGALLPWLVWS
jgi:hypothetical protein